MYSGSRGESDALITGLDQSEHVLIIECLTPLKCHVCHEELSSSLWTLTIKLLIGPALPDVNLCSPSPCCWFCNGNVVVISSCHTECHNNAQVFLAKYDWCPVRAMTNCILAFRINFNCSWAYYGTFKQYNANMKASDWQRSPLPGLPLAGSQCLSG